MHNKVIILCITKVLHHHLDECTISHYEAKYTIVQACELRYAHRCNHQPICRIWHCETVVSLETRW